MNQPFILEELAIHYLQGYTWLVSHGGVASENLRELLSIKYPQNRIFKAFTGRSVRDLVAHFPYPLPTGPKKALYVYGDLYNSIISQVARHPANAAKLHNNFYYPHFNSVQDLFEKGNSSDPFGITSQFRTFISAEVDYPILLVKFSSLEDSMSEICDFIGTTKIVTWKSRNRKAKFDSLPFEQQKKLEEIYGKTKELMDSMPSTLIINPRKEKTKFTNFNRKSVYSFFIKRLIQKIA